MRKLYNTLLLLFGINLYGFEVNTHQALTRCAITNSCGNGKAENLTSFVTHAELNNSSSSTYENINRKGFSFGIGASVMGGCGEEDIYDEMENIIDTETHCGAIPLLDISVGYGFTPQFKLNLELQTLLIVGTLELKGQYYLKDEQDTMYLHGEVVELYALWHSIDSDTTGGFGIGYAKGHAEYELGIILVPSEKPMLSLSVKYMF